MPSGNGQPRVYSISADTANGAVDPTSLQSDVDADVGVSKAVINIETVSDILRIFFDDVLTAPDITALDAIVLAHTGVKSTFSFQFFESNPGVATSSEAWQTAMTSVSSSMSAGIYRISYNLELRIVPVDALNGGALARVMVNGSRKADFYHRNIEWCAFSGWDRKVFAEGESATIEIDRRRDPAEGGNDGIEIRKMKIGVEFMGV